MRADAPLARETRHAGGPLPRSSREQSAPVDSRNDPPQTTRSHLRIIVLAALGLAIASQILWRSMIAHVAESAPDTALWLRPSHAAALARQADAILGRDPEVAKTDPPDHAAVRRMAAQALTGDPLNTTALRVLATVADREDDKVRAKFFMTAAARGSLRESIAHYWLISEGLRTQQYGDIGRHVDILMRTRPQLIAQLTPVLAAIAEKAPEDSKLAELLAGNPPWRVPFFDTLPKTITDARTPLTLLHRLKETAFPPKENEINPYLRFLIHHKYYDLAYYSWLQFLTPEQLSQTGYLYNGGFEENPTGAPFDWSLVSGRGVTVNLLQKPDAPRGRALYLEFGHGRIELNPIAQYTLLSPGDYLLSWQVKGQLTGRRGLVWRLACVENGMPVAASTMMTGPFANWTNLEVAFSIPPQGCRMQSLQLAHDARSASEQIVSGSMWIDDVRIRRKDAAQ